MRARRCGADGQPSSPLLVTSPSPAPLALTLDVQNSVVTDSRSVRGAPGMMLLLPWDVG